MTFGSALSASGFSGTGYDGLIGPYVSGRAFRGLGRRDSTSLYWRKVVSLGEVDSAYTVVECQPGE